MRILLAGVMAILVAIAAYSAIIREVIGALDLDSELSMYLLNKGVFAVLLLAMVYALGHARIVALNSRFRLSTLPVYWPMLIIALLVVAGASDPATDPRSIAIMFLLAASVGIGEELLFRGYVIHWASPLGVRRQIFCSGAAFGAVHLLGLGSGLPPAVILAQAYFAAALGMIFAYGRLRDGSLCLAIVVHTLFDFTAFVANGGIRNIFENAEQIIPGLLLGGTIALIWAAFLTYRAPASLQ
jgi:membrane protease YdiL (CAAX protease family)